MVRRSIQECIDMAIKSASKNAKLGTEEILLALLAKADATDAKLAQLAAENAALKAAAEARPGVPLKAAEAKAAPVVKEFEYELTDAKYGTGLTFTFEGRKSNRFLYVKELRILAKHINAVLAATKHIKD
jgi:hypothetical protein